MDQGTQVILFTRLLPGTTGAQRPLPTQPGVTTLSGPMLVPGKLFYWYFKSKLCFLNKFSDKLCFLNKFSDSMSSLGKHYLSISKYYLTLRHMFLMFSLFHPLL